MLWSCVSLPVMREQLFVFFFPISFQSIAIFYEILSTDLELRGSEIKLPPELISETFNVAELGRSGRQ